MDILDPSGNNSKFYKEIYSNMSDDQFDKEFKKFLNNEDENFYLEIVEFERDLDMGKIRECGDFMKIPLEEYVSFYLTNGDDTISVSPQPIPVGYIHEKRMPQTLLKKSAGSLEIEKRNPLTGQVTGKDKNARNTDTITYALTAFKAENALKELMGPRADDMHAKAQMYNSISKNGYVRLADLDDDPYNKVALNTLDVYFLMQGISTNLVTELTDLPKAKKVTIDREDLL